MRQTGRTARIIDFAIDQLFSVGEVIITDHTAFEYKNVGDKVITNFGRRIEDRFNFHNIFMNKKLVQKVERSKDGVYFVHLKVENIENQQDKK